ncbi:uncharacterized protein LOC144103982 isoform X2 [Amblyomma americanum]
MVQSRVFNPLLGSSYQSLLPPEAPYKPVVGGRSHALNFNSTRLPGASGATMLVQVAFLLMLAAACAWEKSWRSNFVIDRFLPTVGLVQIPLHDISFDLDHTDGTFSGFMEVHLEKGTLGNLRKSVRRRGDCTLYDHAKHNKQEIKICCSLGCRGLVAKYNGEVIIDRKTTSMVVEVLVDGGNIRTCIYPEGNCAKSMDDIKEGDLLNSVSAKLMPLSVSLDLPAGVMKQFEKEVTSRTEVEIARAFNTTYMKAFTVKAQVMKKSDFAE